MPPMLARQYLFDTPLGIVFASKSAYIFRVEVASSQFFREVKVGIQQRESKRRTKNQSSYYRQP